MKSNNQKVLSKKKASGGILETIKTVIYAVLIALIVRTVAFEPFNIPSGSMIPTLLIGDYLFVSKFSYGYSRYSLPLDLPLFHGRILQFRQPARGDVIVFRLPSDPSTDFIKRIVGLPGDRIQMKDSNLYINDQMMPRQKVSDLPCPDRVGEICQLYTETLPGNVQHPIIKHGDGNPLDNTREYDVPPDHYFMMGDNRDNSDDSRDHVGFVPAENLVGIAQFVFFSTDGSAHWWQPWLWPFAVRYGRLFHGIS
ncbi:MAG TPA: signal peptidase I [Stellaceae bacterium]|nr:signal peptidase I [Stellaceae bacterium]